MRVLRWIGFAVLGIVIALFVLSAIARQWDGPTAVFAGGPLIAGELVSGPEPDWRFVRDVSEIQLQILTPLRSRTTWVIEHKGRIFVPCGYMNSGVGRLWKKWPIEAERDGRALVRIEGKRYERSLVRITEPDLYARPADGLAEKYAVPTMGADLEASGLWIFELAPRDVAVSSAGEDC